MNKPNFNGAREGMVRDMERNITPTIVTIEISNGIDIYNVGHGHVWPRKDGNRVRCGGPLCKQCKYDQARKNMSVNPTYEVTYNELSEKLDKAVSLLYRTAQQFRWYEKQHRQKMVDPSITKEKLLETFEKAEANAALAKEIEDQLNELQNRQKT